MKFNDIQKRVLSFSSMSNILYRNMYKENHELGYTSKGKNYTYDINIAADAPNNDIKDIVLIHELGHIYYGHVNKDINNEIESIKNLLKKNNKSILDLCTSYNGFMNFINLCMDFEVNSKLLTLNNIKIINKYFKICMPRNFGIDILDVYSDYYEPLIKKMAHIDEKTNNKAASNPLDNDSKNNNQVPQDLPNRASYNKIAEELKDILKKENYKEGNSKAKEKNLIGETTIRTFIEISNKEENKDDNVKYNSNKNLKDITIRKNPDERIKNFLENILDIETSYKQDFIKHYNRGTRDRSSNILYSSIRQNHCFKTKKKLGIIVDVSSSMDPSYILRGASTLKSYSNNFDPESLLITWNTNLVESFKLNEIPTKIKIEGDTEISSAIEYLILKNFTDIVIYSDFRTSLSKLLKVKNQYNNVKLYSIIVNNNKNIRGFDKFFNKMPTLYLF